MRVLICGGGVIGTSIAYFLSLRQIEAVVIECVALTGNHDLLLKIVARDIEDLADLTLGGILSYESVKDISSCVVLKDIKVISPLPLC